MNGTTDKTKIQNIIPGALRKWNGAESDSQLQWWSRTT